MLTAVAFLTACAGKTAAKDEASDQGKTLVLYYSQTGATKSVAEEIQKQLNADICAIEATVPYDGDYPSTIQRWMQEKTDSVKVEINPINANLDDYTTIFLGFPIWGGTFASPMATFLADNSLEGKKVVTFSTFGSGGIEKATAELAASHPEAEVIEGYGVRNARVAKAPAEITRFLIENGFIEGEIDPLPAFSESAPVSDEEAAIFHAACDNYQFPLGNPVSAATRNTPDGTEYKFEVKSTAPDGSPASSIIYVIAAKDQTPEFTRVVR